MVTISETGFVMWRAVAFGLALVSSVDLIKAALGPGRAQLVQMFVLVLMTAVVLWRTSGLDMDSSSASAEEDHPVRRPRFTERPEKVEKYDKRRQPNTTVRFSKARDASSRSWRSPDDSFRNKSSSDGALRQVRGDRKEERGSAEDVLFEKMGAQMAQLQAQSQSSSAAATAAAAAAVAATEAVKKTSMEVTLSDGSQSSTRCPSITSIPTTPRNPLATPDLQLLSGSAAESLVVLPVASLGDDALCLDKDGIVPATSAAVSEAVSEAGVEIDIGDFFFHLDVEDIADAVPCRRADISADEVTIFIYGDAVFQQIKKAEKDFKKGEIVSEVNPSLYSFAAREHMMRSGGAGYSRSSTANLRTQYAGYETRYAASAGGQYAARTTPMYVPSADGHSSSLQFVPFGGVGYLTLPVEESSTEPSWQGPRYWRDSSWHDSSWSGASSNWNAGGHGNRREWNASSTDASSQGWTRFPKETNTRRPHEVGKASIKRVFKKNS